MARIILPGESIFIPTNLLPNSKAFGTGLIQRKVAFVEERSAILSLNDGVNSPPIAFSKLHRNLGIIIVRIGDFETEFVLLDPLAKSILHFSRLFFDDSFVKLLQVRSIAELEAWLPQNMATFSHLVLVGHCDAKGIKFSVGGNVTPTDFSNICGHNPTHKLTILSLACESGKASFAKQFSKLPFCEAFIAPFQDVHGVVASQFCQSFFAHSFLLGESLTIAHRHARQYTPGSTSFRLWRDGNLK